MIPETVTGKLWVDVPCFCVTEGREMCDESDCWHFGGWADCGFCERASVVKILADITIQDDSDGRYGA
jgi:hypothetical protein